MLDRRLPPSVWIVAAHPDDEVIGATALLLRGVAVGVVHLTDGAPRDPRLVPDEVPVGARTPAAYAALRRREVEASLGLARVPRERIVSLGAQDQGAIDDAVRLADSLYEVLVTCWPACVVTHPYEGGHPDHDAAALVVGAVVARALRERGQAPLVSEMTSYHAGPDGSLVTGEFLPDPRAEVRSVLLTPCERRTKRRMLACFESQRRTLAPFVGARVERFRPAPVHDFARPPHEGAPWYERMGWTTGARWRAAAAHALRALRG